MVPEITGLDVVITNTSGIHKNPMSEYVLGMILSKMKRFPLLYRQQQEKIWIKPWTDEIQGMTVGVLGLGNIGKEIARKCKIMGFDVLGYKRNHEEFEYTDKIYTDTDSLNELLARSDFVVSVLPSTPATVNFMNKERFSAMKKGAYFINVGRGITVDHSALAWAVSNGMIGGAALDALHPEPLPEDSPLWNLENVIITPHMAADSPFYMDRAFSLLRENLERLARGEELQNRIDTEFYSH